jgi:hypothetical protein
VVSGAPVVRIVTAGPAAALPVASSAVIRMVCVRSGASPVTSPLVAAPE